jgi:hypothetical protein
MSFILDALKKADRERNLNKVPTFTTVHIPVDVTGRRMVLWVVAGGLLGAVALVWWLRPFTEPPVAAVQPRPGVSVTLPAEPIEPERGPASAVAGSVPPAVLPEPVPVTPSAAPPRARRQAASERAAGLRPALPVPKLSPQPPPAALPAEAGGAAPVTSVPPALPAPRPETQARPDMIRPPSATIPGASPPAPPAQSAPLPGAPPTVEAARIPSVASPRAPLPPAAPAQPTLREALSKMTLDVFVYTEVETDRMVVINGRRYVKGQLVDGLYLVEGINPDGVVLTYRDERAVLRP